MIGKEESRLGRGRESFTNVYDHNEQIKYYVHQLCSEAETFHEDDFIYFCFDNIPKV